jgi:hypothetical protein
MNPFYKQPILLQWIEAILICLLFFLPALSIIEWGYTNPIYFLLFPIYLPLGQFGTTPLFRLLGIYKYYSPMLLGYMSNNQQIDLHSGGSFDYLFVFAFPGYKNVSIKNRILCYHLEGLLQLINLIERREIPNNVVISGTTYFINERTIQKLGFSLDDSKLFYKLNLFMNIIDLFWMYSLSQGTIALPRIWKSKTIKIIGNDLVASKEKIQNYYYVLSHRTRKTQYK